MLNQDEINELAIAVYNYAPAGSFFYDFPRKEVNLKDLYRASINLEYGMSEHRVGYTLHATFKGAYLNLTAELNNDTIFNWKHNRKPFVDDANAE